VNYHVNFLLQGELNSADLVKHW